MFKKSMLFYLLTFFAIAKIASENLSNWWVH